MRVEGVVEGSYGLNTVFVSPEEEEGEDGDGETDEGDGDTDDSNDPQGECLS